MVLGDEIRYNVATVSEEERNRLRDAFVKLHDVSDARIKYPDGVTYWAKVNKIHFWSHEAGIDIHGGPGFLPWHRELLDRLEKQLQQADKILGHDGKIMLHYWDWTTDPRGGDGTINLLTPNFMGGPGNPVGPPFANFESPMPGHPFIWRNVNRGMAGAPTEAPWNVPPDDTIVANDTYHDFRIFLEGQAHNPVHEYIGGDISNEHFSFGDPWVIILHSNVDRIWAKWQTTPGKEWRLSPATVYGDEASNAALTGNIQPFAGDFQPVDLRLRPWAPPENLSEIKTYKDNSIVIPPRYDTNG